MVLIVDGPSRGSNKFELQISKFKLLGSEGSKVFGKPQIIQKRGNIQNLLQQLFAGSGQKSQEAVASSGASNIDSQALATQVIEEATKNRQPQTKSTNIRIDVFSKDLTDSIQGEHNYPAETRPKQQNKLKSLLGLLKPAALGSISDRKVAETTLRLDSENNGRMSKSPLSIKSSILTKDQNNVQHSSQEPPKTDIQIRNTDDSEKENSQESSRSSSKPSASQKAMKSLPQPNEQKKSTSVSSQLLFDQMENINPFEGLKRIPRRFVRVSEAQANILEQKDAWFEPPHANESVYAKIPNSVRDDLISFLDKQVDTIAAGKSSQNNQEISDEANTTRNEEDSEQSGGEDSEGDEVISWAPSPERIPNPNPSFLNGVGLSSYPDNVSNHSDDEVQPSSPADTDSLPEALETVVRSISVSRSQASFALSQLSTQIIEPPQQRQPDRLLRKPIIPSSSPIEEPLELEIPHAIGDIVDESDEEVENIVEPSQALLSTAPQSSKIIEVRRTPQSDVETSEGKRQKKIWRQRNRTLEDIFSDPIIPATFIDPISTEVLSSNITMSPTWRQPEAHLMDIDNERQQHATAFAESPINDPVDQTEEDMAEDQLLQEYRSSQRQERTWSPPTNNDEISESLEAISSRSERESVPPYEDIDQERLGHPPTPAQELGNAGQVKMPDTILAERSNSLKRGSEDVAGVSDGVKVKHKRRKPISIVEHEDYPIIDTKQMARASRQSFKEKFRPFIEKERLQPTNSSSRNEVPRIDIPSTIPVEDTSAPHTSYASQNESPSVRRRVPDTPRFNTENRLMPIGSATMKEDSLSLCSSENSEANDEAETASGVFFNRFKTAYPDFDGSENNFTWALVYIEYLRVTKKQLIHVSLCDDLIRVMSFEFPQYVRREKALSPSKRLLTGWDYYDQRVPNINYKQEVITPENLQEALSSCDPDVVDRCRKLFEAKPMLDQGSEFSSPKITITPKARLKSEQDDMFKRGYPSPILGSARDTAQPKLKKPFFETASQIHQTNQQKTLDTAINSSPPSSSKPKRSLPWKGRTESTPKSSPLPSYTRKPSPPRIQEVDTPTQARRSSTFSTAINKSSKPSAPTRRMPNPPQRAIPSLKPIVPTLNAPLHEDALLKQGTEDLLEGWLDQQLTSEAESSVADALEHASKASSKGSGGSSEHTSFSKHLERKTKNIEFSSKAQPATRNTDINQRTSFTETPKQVKQVATSSSKPEVSTPKPAPLKRITFEEAVKRRRESGGLTPRNPAKNGFSVKRK